MNRRTLLLAGAAASLSGCADPSAVETFNYRLKIVVLVDGEERAGESVIHVRWRDLKGAIMNYGSRFRTRVWGEAPFVDLGEDRGHLFVLLRGDTTKYGRKFSIHREPLTAFGWGGSADGPARCIDAVDEWSAIRKVRGCSGAIELSRENYPLLVRFADITDPNSITEVNPDRIDKVYGGGVTIQRLTIEMTDEPATERILSVLPWLESYYGVDRRPPDWGSLSFPQMIGLSHFRMWSYGDA